MTSPARRGRGSVHDGLLRPPILLLAAASSRRAASVFMSVPVGAVFGDQTYRFLAALFGDPVEVRVELAQLRS